MTDSNRCQTSALREFYPSSEEYLYSVGRVPRPFIRDELYGMPDPTEMPDPRFLTMFTPDAKRDSLEVYS
jgi:hypothetical protein